MALKNIWFDSWEEFLEFANKVEQAKQKGIEARQKVNSEAMRQSLDMSDKLYEEHREQKQLA